MIIIKRFLLLLPLLLLLISCSPESVKGTTGKYFLSPHTFHAVFSDAVGQENVIIELLSDRSVRVSVVDIPDYSITFSATAHKVTYKNHTISQNFSLSRFYSIYEMFSDLGKSDFSTLKNASKKHYSLKSINTTLFILKNNRLPEKITHSSGDSVIFTELD